MSEVAFAMVIMSAGLQQLAVAVLRANNVVCINPFAQNEDKYLLPYVKQNINDFSSLDAIIVDLGALKDSDEQILEAIEAIRFFDDSIRVIILAGSRTDCFKIMHQCFLNGIYNLIHSGNYVGVRAQLEQAILTGMSYRDALIFREEEEFKRSNKATFVETVSGTKIIRLYGARGRIGVTHCTLTAAYTLCKNGYIVAVVDWSGSQDYFCLAQSYGLEPDEQGYFATEGIDIYAMPVTEEYLEKKAYNFILFDMGDNYAGGEGKADEKILVCGSKPWEMGDLSICIRQNREDILNTKYLFNMTDIAALPDLRKMMRSAGIDEKQIYIMDYLPEIFSISGKIRELLGVERKKRTKRLFGNRK